jgi:hypothetical protein
MHRRKTLFFITLALCIMVVLIYQLIGSGDVEAVSEKTSSQGIYGRVISQYGPVANARVRVSGDDKYALTDRQGRFSLATGHLPIKTLRVTAGKDGWFNNGRKAYPVGNAGDIFLNATPRDDDPGYRFISPTTCARCHNKLARYWDKSKMAHTTSNPKVLNMYYGTDASDRMGIGPGYKLDNPQNDGNCISCHAPSMAESNSGVRDLRSALWSPRTEWDGISCDYCHKVRKVIKKQSRPSHMAPVLKRATPVKGSTILVLGPYDDVVNAAMAASYSPEFDEGRFCSTCHSQFRKLPAESSWNRKEVYSEMEWNGFGLQDDIYLPIQTTYQEWKQWQEQLPTGDENKGKRCQDCHMGWRKEMLPYDNYVVDGQARNMWGTKRSPRNIRPHHFDGGTPTQLKTALAMEIEGEITGKTLNVKVFITNTNGGHWVPTGETMRSVMLLLNATDSSGNSLKLIKGPRLPVWTGQGEVEDGNYAGLPGTVFARVLQDDHGNMNVPFWKATSISFDTRIRPKKTESLEYTFELKDPNDEPTAEAQLIYRPVIKPLAQSKDWKVEDILITSSAW